MFSQEKDFYYVIICTCIVLASLLIYFFYSILKYHKRDLKDKLEIIYGKDGILEEEKLRIGRDIHDGVSSSLTGVKLMIESLQTTSGKDAEKTQEIIEILDSSILNLRSVLNGLVPVNIRNKRLSDVLMDYINKLNLLNGSNFVIDIKLDHDLEFSEERSLQVYRIFQEVIINTHKHAQAQNLRISVIKDEYNVEIVFQDDGVGFDIENSLKTKFAGIGLSNIKYRSGMLNGQIDIYSEKGKGTQINIKFPI